MQNAASQRTLPVSAFESSDEEAHTFGGGRHFFEIDKRKTRGNRPSFESPFRAVQYDAPWVEDETIRPLVNRAKPRRRSESGIPLADTRR